MNMNTTQQQSLRSKDPGWILEMSKYNIYFHKQYGNNYIRTDTCTI